ncbi:MAG: ABC transporter permease [Anaerolineales bacterium]|nr:MAG: ABC transporter permease [Anaerolineales bacterium]
MLKSKTNQGFTEFLTSVVISSRYIPVWIAMCILLVAAYFVAPATLSAASFTAVLPLTAFLVIVSLGQMLVVMTGGIDLSTPGIMTLAAFVTVGVGAGQNENILKGLAMALAVSALIGFTNGFLVGVFRLNALIVTLAIGQITRGALLKYATQIANEASVPSGLSRWAISQVYGVGWIFWIAVIVTLALTIILTYTGVGRRFRAVGANQIAARISGLRVTVYVVSAYVIAAMMYGLAGFLLAAFIRSPTQGLGAAYLLGPIAAVVIGGASLSGGLASVFSTALAAFFLTVLDQMLRVMGLPTSLQFVVFGVAIIGGMAVSGDRIVDMVEGLFQRRFAKAEE